MSSRSIGAPSPDGSRIASPSRSGSGRAARRPGRAAPPPRSVAGRRQPRHAPVRAAARRSSTASNTAPRGCIGLPPRQRASAPSGRPPAGRPSAQVGHRVLPWRRAVPTRARSRGIPGGGSQPDTVTRPAPPGGGMCPGAIGAAPSSSEVCATGRPSSVESARVRSGDTERSPAYVLYMLSTLLVIGGVLVGLLVLLALIVSLSARPQTAARAERDRRARARPGSSTPAGRTPTRGRRCRPPAPARSPPSADPLSPGVPAAATARRRDSPVSVSPARSRSGRTRDACPGTRPCVTCALARPEPRPASDAGRRRQRARWSMSRRGSSPAAGARLLLFVAVPVAGALLAALLLPWIVGPGLAARSVGEPAQPRCPPSWATRPPPATPSSWRRTAR